MPLRIGTDAEFAALRASLEGAGYTEPAVCERLGLKRLGGFRMEGAVHQEREPEDALGLLIWLLMEGGSVADSKAAGLPLEQLRALDVIGAHPGDPRSISASVMLYPVRGLYVASDRSRPLEHAAGPPPGDFVYPAIVPTTEKYLETLPFTPCDAFLDLCSGTGIAAMLAARGGARHAWALDITARSTHFAEFNCRLNAIRNVTALEGDLYQPAGDLTFDRIAAHAPYVPVFRQNMIFDSGGQDGEQIVRRVIEGLPRHLRPGARFYAPLAGTDRDKPFEQRVREWLGSAEDQFDVAFFVTLTLTPGTYVAEAVTRNRATPAEAKPWRELFEQLGIRAIQRGNLLIQRRRGARPVFTVRRLAGEHGGAAGQHWLMDWETSVVEHPEAVLAMRPRAARSIRLRVEHRMTAEGWSPDSYRLEADHPFAMEISAEPWTAHLLASANGTMTSAQLLERLKADGAVHPDTPPLEFAHIVAQLVSGGFLEV